MGKIIKAREIVIPADLPEKMDEIAGHPRGDLREILAENGSLREINHHLLAISLGKQISNLMTETGLPEKPMSLERLSDVSWVIMIAYGLGTISFDDEGNLIMGKMNDVAFIDEVQSAEKLVFRSGIEVVPKAFLPTLAIVASASALKEIYEEMVGKGPFKKKRLDANDAMNYARTLINSTDKLLSDKNVWGEINKI